MRTLKLMIVTTVAVFINVNIICSQVAARIGSFNKVEVFGRVNVRLEKSKHDSLFINSGSSDVEQVKYIIKNGTLIVKLLSELANAPKVNVTIQFSQLDYLEVGGGAKIYNRGAIESEVFTLLGKSGCELDLLVDVDSINVKVNKGAFVRLTGKNKFMQLRTATGGDFRSTKMDNTTTVAVLNGGTAEIKCSDFLDATVRYGGSLKYVEKPKKVKKNEQMGGTIEKLEDF